MLSYTAVEMYLSIAAASEAISPGNVFFFIVGGIFSDSAGVLPSSWDILLGGKHTCNMCTLYISSKAYSEWHIFLHARMYYVCMYVCMYALQPKYAMIQLNVCMYVHTLRDECRRRKDATTTRLFLRARIFE